MGSEFREQNEKEPWIGEVDARRDISDNQVFRPLRSLDTGSEPKGAQGVICLLSALAFHEIGTQMLSEVWIAIDVKAWAPRITSPAVRIIRFSGKALRSDIPQKQIVGGTIRVYSPAKTVADCFKFRNKIGTEIALEALRDCYRPKKATMNELFAAAKVCRVANEMRPYLEFLH